MARRKTLTKKQLAAIRDGLCEAVLVTYGSDQLSRMGRMLGTGGEA